jgi:hypothetical protein
MAQSQAGIDALPMLAHADVVTPGIPGGAMCRCFRQRMERSDMVVVGIVCGCGFDMIVVVCGFGVKGREKRGEELGIWSSFVEIEAGAGRQQEWGLVNASARAAGALHELLHVMIIMEQGVDTSEQKQGVIPVHCRQKIQATCYRFLHSSVRSLGPQLSFSILRAERSVRVRQGWKTLAYGNRLKHE